MMGMKFDHWMESIENNTARIGFDSLLRMGRSSENTSRQGATVSHTPGKERCRHMSACPVDRVQGYERLCPLDEAFETATLYFFEMASQVCFAC